MVWILNHETPNQFKIPFVFRHRPWRQTNGFSAHSSKSSQTLELEDIKKPLLQTHSVPFPLKFEKYKGPWYQNQVH